MTRTTKGGKQSPTPSRAASWRTMTSTPLACACSPKDLRNRPAISTSFRPRMPETFSLCAPTIIRLLRDILPHFPLWMGDDLRLHIVKINAHHRLHPPYVLYAMFGYVRGGRVTEGPRRPFPSSYENSIRRLLPQRENVDVLCCLPLHFQLCAAPP